MKGPWVLWQHHCLGALTEDFWQLCLTKGRPALDWLLLRIPGLRRASFLSVTRGKSLETRAGRWLALRAFSVAETRCKLVGRKAGSVPEKECLRRKWMRRKMWWWRPSCEFFRRLTVSGCFKWICSCLWQSLLVLYQSSDPLIITTGFPILPPSSHLQLKCYCNHYRSLLHSSFTCPSPLSCLLLFPSFLRATLQILNFDLFLGLEILVLRSACRQMTPSQWAGAPSFGLQSMSSGLSLTPFRPSSYPSQC